MDALVRAALHADAAAAAGIYVESSNVAFAQYQQRGLLNSVAIVLLGRSLSREDFGRIIPYLPASIVDALIDDNASHGIVTRQGAKFALTDAGRVLAYATVDVQEASVESMWDGADDALAAVEDVAFAAVVRARTILPPTSPDAFGLFAGVVERPRPAARSLRLVTAMRYWRADAHRAALAAAGRDSQEAHALNRLWDAHRGAERVGQGRVDPGKRGVAALEARGLAAGGAITSEGATFREAIERDTDERAAPQYEGWDGAARERLLHGLRALPTDS